MMKTVIALMFASSILFGCSFTTHLTIDGKYVDKPGERIDLNKSKCGLFTPPEFADIPNVPIDAIAALKPNDHRGKNAILVEHIRALREAIQSDRHAYAQAYATYLQSCM